MPVRINDFTAFIQALTETFRKDEIARQTGISVSELERWRRGGNHYSPKAEELLYGFCVQRDRDLLAAYANTTPPPYELNTDQFSLWEPPFGFNIEPPRVELVNRPTTLGGLPINFPFGISASILTRNSKAIAYYAALGFDILTYKTVRSVRRDVHPTPNWVFVRDEFASFPFDQPIEGDPAHWPDDARRASMANSFGIPSDVPSVWQEDVERAKQALKKGQVLIVSITASPPPGNRDKQILINDFVDVALKAKEAGADIIEANYSCPNTSGDPTGELYQTPELAGEVSLALSCALDGTPLFVKISYLPEKKLVDFALHNYKHINGIVAINTIAMPVVSPSGDQLFPNAGTVSRARAGVSGSLIRPWAIEVVRNLVEIRRRQGGDYDIIALGGVSTPEHVYDFLNLGADAVGSCTAAYLNPYLAIETRIQFKQVGDIGREPRQPKQKVQVQPKGEESGFFQGLEERWGRAYDRQRASEELMVQVQSKGEESRFFQGLEDRWGRAYDRHREQSPESGIDGDETEWR